MFDWTAVAAVGQVAAAIGTFLRWPSLSTWRAKQTGTLGRPA
jgi:hypothetical protein